MFTLEFWKDALERAIRTAAQALVASWATGITGVLDVNWIQAASVAGLAALTSVLMSLAATGRGNSDTASMLKSE